MTKHCLTAGLVLFASSPLLAQAPEGPMAPHPGTQIQQTPPEVLAKLTARVTLVTTHVTVRAQSGATIHNLGQHDFLITDNDAPQKITHFEVGGDPLSVVIAVETSTRIDPMLPQLRKLRVLFTEHIIAPDR